MIVPVMWKQRRIPTLIALFTLLAGIGGGLVAMQTPTLNFLRANPQSKPDQIEITNITDTSFTVSWVTAEAVPGLVKYGQSGMAELVAKDVRDPLTASPLPYHTHWVKISGLTPATNYSFTIQSSGSFFDNNGSPYSVTTAPVLQGELPPIDVAYGTVVTPSNTPAQGAIVYLRAAGVSPQSALVDATGEWVIPLSTARTPQLDQLVTYDPSQLLLELFVQSGQSGSSSVAVLTGNDSPVPSISLGQNYDFRSLAPPSSDDSSSQSSSARFNFAPPAGAIEPASSEDIIIWNPEPNESLATNQPLFLGSAPPDTTLYFTVESTSPVSGTVTSDDRGYWEWNPEVPLSLGNHVITIFYDNSAGSRITVSRNFTVMAAEGTSLPAIEASPSATLTTTPPPDEAIIEISLTPSPTLTSTPTVIPTTMLTPTLTLTLTPSLVATRTPTPTPDQEVAPTATPTPAVPVSGISLPTLSLTAAGIILLGLGAILLL